MVEDGLCPIGADQEKTMRTIMLIPFLAMLLAAGSVQAGTTPAVPAAKASAPAMSATRPAAIPATTKGTAATARCHDASGRFVACAKKPAPVRCRDAKGKFISCRK